MRARKSIARIGRRGRVVAAAVVLALVGAPALPIAAQAAPAEKSPVMRIATSGFVDSFNPFTSIYLTPTGILRYVYENLVQYDRKDGSPTAGLAETWKTSDDGKRWTFTLHDDLIWSDGKPITSQDVKWTYDQMLGDPVMGTANGSLVANFSKVSAPDEKTVVIDLKTPQAPNPGLEIPIVPRHVWSKIKNPSKFANDEDVVGSGPYTLTRYQANQSITLKSNPRFWRGAPRISGIQYVYYTNSDAQIQALRAGDVDFVSGLTSTQYDALKGQKGITVHSGQGRRFTGIGINSGAETAKGVAYGNGAAALKDVKVREAIRLGIDAKNLMKNVIDGQGVIGTGIIPAAWSTWSLPPDDRVLVSYSPAKAKATLEDDGWTPGSDGIREKDGQRLSLRFLADASDPTETAMTQYLVPWMKDIGIELKVDQTDADTISDRTTAGDFDLYVTGWSVGPDPDYQLGINLCSSRPDADGTGPTTEDAYCSKKFDTLFSEQHSELDRSKRADLVRQMQRLHYEDVANIVLWYPKSLEAYRSDRFTGFTVQPSDDGVISGQSGYWGFLNTRPAGTSAQAAGGSGPSPALWIGIAIAVVAAIAVVLVIVLRRRRTVDERE